MEKSGSVLRQVCKGKNSQQFPWINEGGDSLASSWIDPKQPIFNMPFLVGGGGGEVFYPTLEPGNCVCWKYVPF